MNDHLQDGCPCGGGVLWRKNISHAYKIFDLSDVRLLGIDVDIKDDKLFLLNAHLPYQSPDNYEEYCNYLGKIASIVEKTPARLL